MLKLFGREKVEHPLADIKEARRILGELPPEDPLFSLEEITHWLASVRDEASFKTDHRTQVLQLLDETGQGPVRRLAREYLQAHRQLKQRESRIWPAMHGFWSHIASAYTHAAEVAAKENASSLPLLAARGLRALSAQHKWSCMRYGATDARLWETAARVHAAIGNPKIASVVVNLPSTPQTTTVEHELSRLLMFAACSPHSLTPLDMELCERLIGHFASRFTLSADSTADTPYWIDLGAGTAPHRGPLPAHTLGPICFFGAGQAYDALRIMKSDLIAAGSLPEGMDLGGTYEFRQVISVLDHLEAHWAPRLPERRHARQPMKSRLTVVHGFDDVYDVLQPAKAMVSNEDTESWIVQNVSTGGFGAEVPQINADWLRVGCMVGLQTEGSGQWSMGIVRRLTRTGNQQASVGIQTLTRAALPVEVRILTDKQMLANDKEIGIVLPALRANDELRLVLRPGIYAPGQMFAVEGGSNDRMLLPTRVAERSADYEILACKETARVT